MLSIFAISVISSVTTFCLHESWILWRHSRKHIVVGDHVYWYEDGVKISGIFNGWVWKNDSWPSGPQVLYGDIKFNIGLENEGDTKEILGKKLHLLPLPKLKKEKQLGYEGYRG